MLMLSRWKNQRTVIRDTSGNLLVTMTVCAVQGDKVRLGWEAGPTIIVDREETDLKRWSGKNVEPPPPQEPAFDRRAS